jgi:hypothetical protein
MNQTILRPAPEQELPDWSRLEQRERKDYKDFRTVPDFDQMLLNVAKNNKSNTDSGAVCVFARAGGADSELDPGRVGATPRSAIP